MIVLTLTLHISCDGETVRRDRVGVRAPPRSQAGLLPNEASLGETPDSVPPRSERDAASLTPLLGSDLHEGRSLWEAVAQVLEHTKGARRLLPSPLNNRKAHVCLYTFRQRSRQCPARSSRRAVARALAGSRRKGLGLNSAWIIQRLLARCFGRQRAISWVVESGAALAHLHRRKRCFRGEVVQRADELGAKLRVGEQAAHRSWVFVSPARDGRHDRIKPPPQGVAEAHNRRRRGTIRLPSPRL